MLTIHSITNHSIFTAAFPHAASCVNDRIHIFSLARPSSENMNSLPQCSLYPMGLPRQLCCVRTMGAVSCRCFLFPVSVSWYYSPKRKLALIAPPSRTQLCLTPYMGLSDHLSKLPSIQEDWWSIVQSHALSTFSFHHSIVLTKRVTQQPAVNVKMLYCCALQQVLLQSVLMLLPGLLRKVSRGCDDVTESIYKA